MNCVIVLLYDFLHLFRPLIVHISILQMFIFCCFRRRTKLRKKVVEIWFSKLIAKNKILGLVLVFDLILPSALYIGVVQKSQEVS